MVLAVLFDLVFDQVLFESHLVHFLLQVFNFLHQLFVLAGQLCRAFLTFELIFEIQLFDLKLDPITEPFIINQNSVLNAAELLDNWDQVSALQDISIIEFQNVVEFGDSHVPVVLFVDFIDRPHDFH